MDSCALIPQKARSSFVKPRVEAPRQVIGFNLSPKAATLSANGGFDDLLPNSEIISKASGGCTSPSLKGASSPRSALQQLLLKPLHQSQPASSSPSAIPNLTRGPLKPECLLLQPASSSPPSSDQGLTGRHELLRAPAAISSPSANQSFTSGIFKSVGQSQCASSSGGPSASRSSGLLKTLVQSECATLETLANQDTCTSNVSSFRQSRGGSPSGTANQRLTCGEGVEQESEKSRQERKDNYAAFFRIKSANHEACPIRYQIKGRLAADGGIKEVISHEQQHSCVGKSSKSIWKEVQADDQQPACARTSSQKSSWVMKEQVPINEHHACYDGKSKKSGWNEATNPEKSKKSSLFMFVVSSPGAEYHQDHHLHHDAERNMDFLSSCHLCRRLLSHGKDVFMYSGDKAFCSMECRYQQIVIDERNERRTPPVIRAGAFTTTAAAAATHHPNMINKSHFINNTAAAA
eukprot:c24428_g1_i1 orf=1101-2492(-)